MTNSDGRSYFYLDSCSRGPADGLPLPSPVDDWRMHVAPSIEHARELIEERGIRIGVVDLVPGAEDLVSDAIAKLGGASRFLQWIGLVSEKDAPCTDDRCAELVAEHFFDYHTRPIDPARFAVTLGHALGMSRAMEHAASTRDAHFEEKKIVGTSPVMIELLRTLRKVAGSDAPVFIFGESGTGKELAARSIHERSPRRDGPFVALDCGSIPATLIQSELFGYEKGAFTGAAQRKIGRIEAASGGTVFLDEVGDLPLELQANLLRFLQESTIQRVGGTQPIAVDARVIAATHIDLDEAVRQGRFRQDLFFRLCVLRITTPPLRDRIEDVESLAKYFFEHFSRDPASSRPLLGFSAQALDAMRAHDWPGNVRELINRVRRAIVMCDGRMVTPRDLDLASVLAQGPRAISLGDARTLAERETITAALRTASFNMSRAARSLGVSRVTLYRLVEKHRLSISGVTGLPLP